MIRVFNMQKVLDFLYQTRMMSSFSSLLSLSQLTEIMQLMNAYFNAIHRQRGKGEDPDITITESTEMSFRHLAPTPTPTLLELPSHPV